MANTYLGKRSKKAVMQPKVLYKKSNLKQNMMTREIGLQALWSGALTGLNADAVCAQFGIPHGQAPARLCSCGFYAYKEYSAARLHPQKGDFIIRVVGSGKMFEYDTGYRFSHQRLEEVITTFCFACYEPADRLITDTTTSYIRPTCSDHSEDHEYVMSFTEFEELASCSLPEGAPKITIRSSFEHLTPYGQKASPFKTFRNKSKSDAIMDGILIGLACVTAVSLGSKLRKGSI